MKGKGKRQKHEGNPNPNPGLIVIGGPTATGKSGLAMQLADRLQTVILSADSRQIYQAFDIGTAKPSLADRQRIPHYLIDCYPPTDNVTVAEYQQQAQRLIDRCHRDEHWTMNRTPLLVGGTGLYSRAIVQGLSIPAVPPQPDLRSQLESLGQPQCYAMLQSVDSIAAQKIHPHDAVRTLRALEVFYVTGQPISAQQGENPPSYPILQLGLDCATPDRLRQRIQQRTGQMLEMGLVAEVETLCQRYGADLPLLATLGYREVKQYLQGDISLTDAEILVIQHTSQFAKRQRTWFRAEPDMIWFDADAADLEEQVWRRVQQWLDEIRV